MKHNVIKYSCDICTTFTEPDFLVPVVNTPLHTNFYKVGTDEPDIMLNADKHVCTNCIHSLIEKYNQIVRK